MKPNSISATYDVESKKKSITPVNVPDDVSIRQGDLTGRQDDGLTEEERQEIKETAAQLQNERGG